MNNEKRMYILSPDGYRTKTKPEILIKMRKKHEKIHKKGGPWYSSSDKEFISKNQEKTKKQSKCQKYEEPCSFKDETFDNNMKQVNETLLHNKHSGTAHMVKKAINDYEYSNKNPFAPLDDEYFAIAVQTEINIKAHTIKV